MRTIVGRFFVEGVHAVGGSVALAPEDARKLRTVLRARGGERVELRDSTSTKFFATIASVSDQEVTVLIDEAAKAEASELAISLAQCMPKGGKMDYIIEKGTELGVISFFPVQSSRVIGEREGSGKLERWRRLARSAAAQCGAARIPEVQAPKNWSELCASFRLFERVIVPWELTEHTPQALGPLVAGVHSLLVVIGPEGGLSHAELDEAVSAGATAISLGARILRTETAGLVAIASARYAAGEI